METTPFPFPPLAPTIASTNIIPTSICSPQNLPSLQAGIHPIMQNPSSVSSSSSSRAEAFPAGLRVLVVDDDPTWLKILEKMLRKCSYEVTTCGLARVALDMLRERSDRFDIVISDVNMPDMDGFKLLEHVGLEMDLPVIMMSVDGETSRVMKGVQHGACDYLLKPVRMKELRNIWQHVFRKKMHEMKEVESHHWSGEFQLLTNRFEEYDERPVYGGEQSYVKRRKDSDINMDQSEADVVDSVSVKKARVVWSVGLHQTFVNAVNQIGFDKVGPKKILDLMNVPGLTRENVASHLQKYRLYLSRLQKQNDGINFGGDLDSKDCMANLCPQGSKADGIRFTSKRSHLPGIKQEASGAMMQREQVAGKALSSTCSVSQKARTAAPRPFPPPSALITKYKPADETSRINHPDHHGWGGSIRARSRRGRENLRDDHFGSTTSSGTSRTVTAPATSGGTHDAYAAGYNGNNDDYVDNNTNINTTTTTTTTNNNNNNAVYVNSVSVAVDRGVPLGDSKRLNVGGLDGINGPVGTMKLGRYPPNQCLFGNTSDPTDRQISSLQLRDDCWTPEDLLLLSSHQAGEWYGCLESVGTGIPNLECPCQPPQLPGNLYDGLQQLDCENVLELMKHPTIGADLFT